MSAEDLKMGRTFGIGALSRATGCKIETIRYYERIGLLPAPRRSAGGHRVYGENGLRRLTFIRRSRDLGFSLKAVRGLLDLVDGGDFTCTEVGAVADRHLGDVRAKIGQLQAIEKVLKSMVAECDRGDVPDCPIVDALFEAHPQHDSR